MSKPLSIEVLTYIFEHCNDHLAISQEMLRSIEAAMDPDKPRIKSLKKDKIDLTVFIKGYAKRCLQSQKNDLKAAQKKFIQDLCIEESVSQYLIHLSPMYQISNLIMESIQKSSADEYVYSEAAKIALSIIIVYVNLSSMGWRNYLSNNAILMTGEMIDCSRLTSNTRVNDLIEKILKELIPLAVFVGVQLNTIDAPLISVMLYMSLGFIVIRLVQTAVHLASHHIMGNTSTFAQYAQNQLAFGFAGLAFMTLFPFNEWFSSPVLKKCLNPQYEHVIGQSFNLIELKNSVNMTKLSADFRKFSSSAYQFGKPKNETLSFIVNEFYNCMRKPH